MEKFRKKRLLAVEQIGRMQNRHPNFKCRKAKKGVNGFQWDGSVKPTRLSESYKIRVTLQQGKHPQIRVLEPILKLRPGAKRIPHTYADGSLCLYTREKFEWHPMKHLADTVIPWISSYLCYYEWWLSSGIWFGDGTDPAAYKNN